MQAMQTCPQCARPVPAGSRFCQDCGADVTAPTKRKTSSDSGPRKAQPKRTLLAVLAVVLLAGAAMTGISLTRGGDKVAPVDVKSATHIHEMPMPGWLKSADIGIKQEYMWAADNWEILQYMPCYCGCGQDPFDHRNNYACYFKYDSDGSITGFDEHGYG